jgi:23S rRNA pseudouridine2605 synthase
MPEKQQRQLKTLERVLSKAGLGSRTEARRWISDGRVDVNGETVRDPDHWIDMVRDRVLFDRKPLVSAEKIYILLYKPKGYITSNGDPEGRPTVYDLIQDLGQWVVPVGRLDQDTSGLLLMTNDTQFAERIMNPEYKVSKTYLVKASTILTDAQLKLLRTGLQLSDGPTKPAIVRRLDDGEGKSTIEITITEGRNRQVRRMLEAVESRVRKLVRIAIGPMRIDKLEIGKWRRLTPREVRMLSKIE